MSKEENLSNALSKLQKKYGQGVVIDFEDKNTNVEAIPTGSIAIDGLLGCGGLPRGRIIEVYGQESSGKSTLCLFFAAQVQKQGGVVAYLDVENAYDHAYATSVGLDTKKALISQPQTLEETFDIIRALTESNAVDLIVVDSVAAMVPKQELESDEMLKDTVALQARLIGKGLRILTGPVSRSKTVVIFINQLRANVGIMYGPKDVTPGGKALKFYSSVRLSVTRGDKLEKDGTQIGNVIKVVAKKNKVGFPFKEATIDLYYGKGIDLAAELGEVALAQGVLRKEGNTYYYGEGKLGVGKGQLSAALQDEKLAAKIKKQLK